MSRKQIFVICVIGAFGSRAIGLIFGGPLDVEAAADIVFGSGLALGFHWFWNRG